MSDRLVVPDIHEYLKNLKALQETRIRQFGMRKVLLASP